jgi:hypothetical protein
MNTSEYAVVISQSKQSQMGSAFFTSTNRVFLLAAFEKTCYGEGYI